jgi:hypothetical protein
MKSILFILLPCFLILSTLPPASAEQTDRCHCFRDRSYDPSDKFAADDYLLTTSYNSLIAATLGVSKRQIVMMKMKGGIDPDELLTALYVTSVTKAPMDQLLSIRENGGSWQSILNSPSLQEEDLSDPVIAEIRSGSAAEDTAALITDAMIRIYYHALPEKIKEVRGHDFSNKELALLFALQQQTDTPIKEIITISREQGMSWSEIAHQFKLSPSAIGKAIHGKMD